MIKRIAFLSRLPPLALFSKTFGIDYFSKSGFEVFFLDLSFLIDGQNVKNLYKDQSRLIGCKVVSIHKKKELDSFVKESAANTIFIDFVAGLSEYDLNIGKVFRILKKYNAKYYLISNGNIPSSLEEQSSIASTVYLRIKKVLINPNKLFEFVARKIIVQLIKFDLIYPKPHRVFGIKDNPSLLGYIKKYQISKSSFFSINSRDYDIYLEYMKAKGKEIKTDKICVFLDEDHTNHPDYFVLGDPPLNTDKYISSMTLFFDYVEKITGLSIVIAAHPKSRFSSDNHPYGNRLFVKGNTVGLIAKCKMAIAHSSTSINFPVLFCKPITLVVTSEMKKRSNIITNIKNFARELEISDIDIDSGDDINKFKVDLGKQYTYKKYLYSYVKNKKPIKKSTWEVVTEAAFKD